MLVNNIKEYEHLRSVPITILEEMKKQINEDIYKEKIDKGLSTWLSEYFDFEIPKAEMEYHSLMIIATKSPMVKTIFKWEKKDYELILPPTYLDFISTPALLLQQLEEAYNGMYHFKEATNIPNKLLAVMSGLASYGRNNLCYVSGLGSYILLTAFYTTMQVENNTNTGFTMLERCNNCKACIKNCLTGALTDTRFTFSAERCITYNNEYWGPAIFYDWIPSNAHNSIVGCMRCQSVCPENMGKLSIQEEIVVFEADEVASILQKTSYEMLEMELKNKLEKLNLNIYYGCLARNLEVLLS